MGVKTELLVLGKTYFSMESYNRDLLDMYVVSSAPSREFNPHAGQRRSASNKLRAGIVESHRSPNFKVASSKSRFNSN